MRSIGAAPFCNVTARTYAFQHGHCKGLYHDDANGQVPGMVVAGCVVSCASSSTSYLVVSVQLKAERIYWDQAGVLVQLGLLDPSLLPRGAVRSAAEQAAKVCGAITIPCSVLLKTPRSCALCTRQHDAVGTAHDVLGCSDALGAFGNSPDGASKLCSSAKAADKMCFAHPFRCWTSPRCPSRPLLARAQRLCTDARAAELR